MMFLSYHETHQSTVTITPSPLGLLFCHNHNLQNLFRKKHEKNSKNSSAENPKTMTVQKCQLLLSTEMNKYFLCNN